MQLSKPRLLSLGTKSCGRTRFSPPIPPLPPFVALEPTHLRCQRLTERLVLNTIATLPNPPKNVNHNLPSTTKDSFLPVKRLSTTGWTLLPKEKQKHWSAGFAVVWCEVPRSYSFVVAGTPGYDTAIIRTGKKVLDNNQEGRAKPAAFDLTISHRQLGQEEEDEEEGLRRETTEEGLRGTSATQSEDSCCCCREGNKHYHGKRLC